MEREDKNYKIGLVIMASGLGKRFGSNKLMEDLKGKKLIKWVIDSTDGLFYKRIVVTRSMDVCNLCNSINVNCILHEFPDRNDTVRIGLNELKEEVDYCFFMQADQPLISTESIKKMILNVIKNKNMIVRAGYSNITGAPMGFPKIYFDELCTLPKGKGGNYIAQMYPASVCPVAVFHEYELWDVDTVADLERINSILDI